MRPDIDSLVRTLRRRALPSEGEADPTLPAVADLLPHRPPFLLLDRLLRRGAENTLLASRRVDPADPVFAGHFPDRPLYPGVLQVEAIAQAGVCQWRLLTGHESGHKEPGAPRIVATRVHHALFLAPIGPGADLLIEAEVIEDDEWAVLVAGRIAHRSTLSSLAIVEFQHAPE